MDDTQALKIISALANGLDPTTDEPVEGPAVVTDVHHGEVTRSINLRLR